MSKYDKVSYPDDQHFVNSADGEEYHSTGNGIYNVYTVGMSEKRDTFKLGCLRLQKSRKTFIILATLVLVVFAIVLAIIVTAAKSKKNNTNDKTFSPAEELFLNPEEYGLFAYPTGDYGLLNITFKPEFLNYKNYYEQIVNKLHEYSAVAQYEYTDYVDCNSTTSSIPKGKSCRFPPEQFGLGCSELNLYGFEDGQPCVLLQLKLGPGLIPKPLNETSSLKVHGLKKDQIDSNSVSITCEGKSEEDKNKIGTSMEFGPPIEFHPKTGFPIFYYKFTEGARYIPPAVMVKFNQLETHKGVVISCTAWAENLVDEEHTFRPLYTRNIYLKVY